MERGSTPSQVWDRGVPHPRSGQRGEVPHSRSRQGGGYPIQQTGGVPHPGLSGVPPPWDEVPPLPNQKTEQHSEHLLRGGRYASCVHAGGLSCFNIPLSVELHCTNRRGLLKRFRIINIKSYSSLIHSFFHVILSPFLQHKVT